MLTTSWPAMTLFLITSNRDGKTRCQSSFYWQSTLFRDTWGEGGSQSTTQFLDASTKMYGVVMYFSVILEDTTVLTFLVAAECRVAPIKTQTISHIEFCKAFLQTNLLYQVSLDLNRVQTNKKQLQCGCMKIILEASNKVFKYELLMGL